MQTAAATLVTAGTVAAGFAFVWIVAGIVAMAGVVIHLLHVVLHPGAVGLAVGSCRLRQRPGTAQRRESNGERNQYQQQFMQTSVHV